MLAGLDHICTILKVWPLYRYFRPQEFGPVFWRNSVVSVGWYALRIVGLSDIGDFATLSVVKAMFLYPNSSLYCRKRQADNKLKEVAEPRPLVVHRRFGLSYNRHIEKISWASSGRQFALFSLALVWETVLLHIYFHGLALHRDNSSYVEPSFALELTE